MSTTQRGSRIITDEDISAVTEAARAHERSVLRRVLGLPVRGRVAADIDRELVARGLIDSTNSGRAA